MASPHKGRGRAALIWIALLILLVMPVAAAAMSPLLAWRDAIYIAAGFAGIAAMSLMLLQPLLAAGVIPGLSIQAGRRVHRWGGIVLILAILCHVAGLWITSPPDMVDALLFRAPTWFSVWGVIAMWAAFAAGALAALRRRLRLAPSIWRRAHTALTATAVLGSVAHAMLIEGTMELVSKTVLCAAVLAATAMVTNEVWASRKRRRAPR